MGKGASPVDCRDSIALTNTTSIDDHAMVERWPYLEHGWEKDPVDIIDYRSLQSGQLLPAHQVADFAASLTYRTRYERDAGNVHYMVRSDVSAYMYDLVEPTAFRTVYNTKDMTVDYYAKLETSPPPIVASSKRLTVVDGNHRLAAWKIRHEDNEPIPAFIAIPQPYDLLQMPIWDQAVIIRYLQEYNIEQLFRTIHQHQIGRSSYSLQGECYTGEEMLERMFAHIGANDWSQH